MKLTCALAVCLASSAVVLSAASDIRVTGEYTLKGTDRQELAMQLALADGRSKALQQAVLEAQRLAAVRALGLTRRQLEAFIAATVEIEEPAARPVVATAAAQRASVIARLDADGLARALAGLRKDQDAAATILALHAQRKALQQRLADQAQGVARPAPDADSESETALRQTLTDLSVTFLAAQAAAGLARIEENTVGGRTPSAQGRERARRRAEAALALAPDSPDARYVFGDLLIDAGQPEAAETEYRRALRLQPASSAGHVKLAGVLRLQGRFRESIAELREAIRIDHGSAAAHSDLGLVLRAQQNIPEAMAEYSEALRLDPDAIDAHNGLAVILAGRGRLPDAAAEFREIVRIDPDSAIGYYNLATVLADMDQDAESAAALREVIRINPNHYNAHYNLGELFRLEGKYDESAKRFRDYVRLAPDTPQNQRNIQRARELIASFENP